MEKVEVIVSKEGAPEVDPDFNLRRLQPESLERHRGVRGPNCSCLSQTVPEATFNCVLKCFFLTVLLLSVLSDILLGLHFPKDNLPNSRASWNVVVDLTWLFIPTVTDWKTNILLVIFAAVVYVGAFLRKLKKTTGSAPQREEEVQTISASMQQV